MYRWMVLDRVFEEKNFELLKLGASWSGSTTRTSAGSVTWDLLPPPKDDTNMPPTGERGKYLLKGVT